MDYNSRQLDRSLNTFDIEGATALKSAKNFGIEKQAIRFDQLDSHTQTLNPRVENNNFNSNQPVEQNRNNFNQNLQQISDQNVSQYYNRAYDGVRSPRVNNTNLQQPQLQQQQLQPQPQPQQQQDQRKQQYPVFQQKQQQQLPPQQNQQQQQQLQQQQPQQRQNQGQLNHQQQYPTNYQQQQNPVQNSNAVSNLNNEQFNKNPQQNNSTGNYTNSKPFEQNQQQIHNYYPNTDKINSNKSNNQVSDNIFYPLSQNDFKSKEFNLIGNYVTDKRNKNFRPFLPVENQYYNQLSEKLTSAQSPSSTLQKAASIAMENQILNSPNQQLNSNDYSNINFGRSNLFKPNINETHNKEIPQAANYFSYSTRNPSQIDKNLLFFSSRNNPSSGLENQQNRDQNQPYFNLNGPQNSNQLPQQNAYQPQNNNTNSLNTQNIPMSQSNLVPDNQKNNYNQVPNTYDFKSNGQNSKLSNNYNNSYSNVFTGPRPLEQSYSVSALPTLSPLRNYYSPIDRQHQQTVHFGRSDLFGPSGSPMRNSIYPNKQTTNGGLFRKKRFN